MKMTQLPRLPKIPVVVLMSIVFPASAQVEYGIAAEFAHDSGIANHPRVVFTEDFEEAAVSAMQKRWSDEGEVQRGEFMEFSSDVPPQSGGRQSLTGPGNDEGPGLYRRLTGDGTGYDQLYLRFYGKLDTACGEIHHYSWMGGHNPSTRWPNPRAGYAPEGDSHFSSGAEPGADGWDFYTYWKDMGCWGSGDGECHGNCFLWNNPKPSVVKGEWFCWEMMIKVNDPPGESNGEQAFWINGVRYAHFGPGFPNYASSGTDRWGTDSQGSPWPGFQWRTDPALKVNYLWIYNYVHDDFCRAWFDDVVAATSYIGPMVNEKQTVHRQLARNGGFHIGVHCVHRQGRPYFTIDIPEGATVRLSIFNTQGECVTSYPACVKGRYEWNGPTPVSGLYLVRAAGGNRAISERFVIVR